MKVLKLCRLETMNFSIDACLKGLSGRAPNTFAKILKTGAVDKHWGETCVTSRGKPCKTLASGRPRTELIRFKNQFFGARTP
jgi:hypothetical protein